MNFQPEIFRKYREKWGTREKLAQKLGKTDITISNWELGKSQPSYTDMVECAKLFGVPLDAFSDKFAKLREDFKDLPPDILEKGLTGHYMLDTWEEDMKKMTREEQIEELAKIELELRTIYLERQRAKIQKALKEKGG